MKCASSRQRKDHNPHPHPQHYHNVYDHEHHHHQYVDDDDHGHHHFPCPGCKPEFLSSSSLREFFTSPSQTKLPFSHQKYSSKLNNLSPARNKVQNTAKPNLHQKYSSELNILSPTRKIHSSKMNIRNVVQNQI